MTSPAAALRISRTSQRLAIQPPVPAALSRGVATANQHYGYDELLYVRKHYFSLEALRQANATVVNKILALRDPRLWGEGHACASDGTRFDVLLDFGYF